MNIISIGGGSLRKKQTLLIDRHIVRCTGKGSPRALFIPTASGDDREYCDAFDRVYADALRHPASFRDRNVFVQIAADPALGRIVRFVQWPAYFDDVLARYRTDPRLFAIVAPLIGRDLKQIINQMHWKPPGAAKVDFGYHQDIHFRRPVAAYRAPGESYVQTMIAIDPQTRENGGLAVYPGSHRTGALEFPERGRIMDADMSEADLEALGLDPAKLVHLDLAPGDVAFWHLCTIHGSCTCARSMARAPTPRRSTGAPT